MLLEHLFERILIEPARQFHADQLLILSRRVSVNMVVNHFQRLREVDRSIKLHLIVGQTAETGIHTEAHEVLTELCRFGMYESQLDCRYVIENKPVNSNIYIWLKNQKPLAAYFGSAIYTDRGFDDSSRNIMIEIDPQDAMDYFSAIRDVSVRCVDKEAELVVLPLPNCGGGIRFLYSDVLDSHRSFTDNRLERRAG